MKFIVSTAKEALSQFADSSYISKSGIYDVTIKFASVAISKGGAESINFNLDYNGNDMTVYGPYITSKEGNTIEIGAKLINSLAVIAGMKNDQAFTTEEEEHVTGKDKKLQKFEVITNFSDLPVKIHLQEEYSRNPETAEIKKRMVIKGFYRSEDGADAAEVVSGNDIGKRLAVVTEKYANNVTYADSSKNAGDAPTPEEVAAWKASKKADSTAPAAKPTPKAVIKPASKLFN